MYLSIDLAVKNMGIFISDDLGNPLHIECFSLYPYNIEILSSNIERLIKICENFDIDKKSKIIILVERQPPINYKTCKIMHQMECYFFLKKDILNISKFILVDSKNKNINSKLKYIDRKKESISKAIIYLNKFNSKNCLNDFNKMKKKDDVADAICQLYYFVENLKK